MYTQRRASFWTTVGGVCTVILVACGSETITLAPVTDSVQTAGNSTESVGFTSALFGSDEAVTLSSSAEMLAVFNLPEGTANLNNVSQAARLLLDPAGALRPIENLPELANADVAQPAGLLNLADVAVVLASAQTEGEPPSKAELAEQVSRVLDEPGGDDVFEARNVRVVPTRDRLGDDGQPGGGLIATSDRTEVIAQIKAAINSTLMSITSSGSVEVPPGTEIDFPGTPDPQQALQVSFNPTLTPSRQSEFTFTAEDLNCEGTRCFLGGIDIVPDTINPPPGDYEVTYTFRYSDGRGGFVEESALRVLSVFEDELVPPPPEPTPTPTPVVTPTPDTVLMVTSTEDNRTDDNEVTLREAIIAANTDGMTDSGQMASGADVIELGVGDYVLALEGIDENEAATGDLDIDGELRIVGAGAESTIIDANDIDRVFEVLSGGMLTLEGVTIQGGRVSGSSPKGGGIFNGNLAGTVNIVNSKIESNTIVGSNPLGGGIYSGNRNSAVIISNSVISGNTSESAGGSFNRGGGIYNGSDSTFEISESTVSGNVVNFLPFSGSGGGIANDGRLTIKGSTISNNRAANGGGLYQGSEGILTLEKTINRDSVISENNATDSGGGAYLYGSATISDTTVMDNSSYIDAGGLQLINANIDIYASDILGNVNSSSIRGGAGIHMRSSVLLNVEESIISDNQTEGSGGGLYSYSSSNISMLTYSTITGNNADRGGGIFFRAGNLDVSHSTVASNTAEGRDAGGIGIDPGGTLELTDSTIYGNTAQTSGGGISARGSIVLDNVTLSANEARFEEGGGLSFDSSTVSATIENSIISDNLADGAPDIFNGGEATHMDIRSSLVGRVSPTVDVSDSSNLVNVDPRFDSDGLQNNGGFTQTLGILPDSPAIDAGLANVNTSFLDQRGLPRIKDGDEDGTATLDMGAFEFP